jgi:hypothetical protein
MAVEKFANLAETTLASGYTSGGASISVTSASGFPTSGTFRVRLGNAGQTIYRIDSVAGTTFTGGAEFNDANANSGQTVKIVASRQVAERWLQAPSSGEILAYAGLSGVDRYGPAYPLLPVVAADFSWTNQGDASVVDSGGVSMISAPNTTTNVRLRKKAKSGVFTITVLVAFDQASGNNSEMGLMLRESGTDKMVGLCQRDASLFSVQRWSSVTAIGSTLFNRSVGMTRGRAWFRMRNDGTNIISSYSVDGVNFTEVDSHAKTASFTTDSNEAGYFVCPRSSGADQRMSVLSWVES